jgi:hypothetical protein
MEDNLTFEQLDEMEEATRAGLKAHMAKLFRRRAIECTLFFGGGFVAFDELLTNELSYRAIGGIAAFAIGGIIMAQGNDESTDMGLYETARMYRASNTDSDS